MTERSRGSAASLRSPQGRLAQMARALPSHGRGRWFESNIAHCESPGGRAARRREAPRSRSRSASNLGSPGRIDIGANGSPRAVRPRSSNSCGPRRLTTRTESAAGSSASSPGCPRPDEVRLESSVRSMTSSAPPSRCASVIARWSTDLAEQSDTSPVPDSRGRLTLGRSMSSGPLNVSRADGTPRRLPLRSDSTGVEACAPRLTKACTSASRWFDRRCP